MPKITEVKTPGKLMIAGEYAVLEPYQPLIVTAVDRFIHVTVEQASENQLSLIDYDLMAIAWDYNDEKLIIQHTDTRLSFVEASISLALQYLNREKVQLEKCHIHIKSELVDASGIKYGLGSSAAVVVATIKGLLTHFIGTDYKQMDLFKLAAMAHVIVQKSGSGADVAASTFGGLLKYTSFQAEWLSSALEQASPMQLIDIDWPYLSIESLVLPEHLKMYVGWTGHAASTKKLVALIKQSKAVQPAFYNGFLRDSKLAVKQIEAGMKTKDIAMIYAGLENNRKILSNIGKKFAVPVETEKLFLLSQSAKALSGSGKLSGAGGGDCGIAFLEDKIDPELLYDAWREQGIKPLDLQPFKF